MNEADILHALQYMSTSMGIEYVLSLRDELANQRISGAILFFGVGGLFSFVAYELSDINGKFRFIIYFMYALCAAVICLALYFAYQGLFDKDQLIQPYLETLIDELQ